MNIFKALIFIAISIVFFGCAGGVVVPPSPPTEPSCKAATDVAYKIFNECYQEGVSKTVNSCAILTIDIAKNLIEVYPDKPEFVAKVSLACGRSCSLGATNKRLPSYGDIEDKFCN